MERINTLSLRIATLGECYEEPATGEAEEKELREKLLMYASGLRSEWMLKLF